MQSGVAIPNLNLIAYKKIFIARSNTFSSFYCLGGGLMGGFLFDDQNI